jgi:hypothetical protein
MADTEAYSQIVEKMAHTLRTLEVEGEFLSNHLTKKNLQNILQTLLEGIMISNCDSDLNYLNETQIPINDANTINLRLFPKYKHPPIVRDHEVCLVLIILCLGPSTYYKSGKEH